MIFSTKQFLILLIPFLIIKLHEFRADLADVGELLSQRTKTKFRVDKIVPELQKILKFVNLSITMHVFVWTFFLGLKNVLNVI